ncbi:PREDICTED: uncharacterized protein LOC105966612 [Erythranthe guttata]|uniref:uncharacterized protein LOC105966612 n=1 Tax=Erythranthe guttata TaxID=4155 RepID=UPI00064D8101|nr:PREDICTED: uncharacterized protein LOC105966612 [Erythranthe guttata]|eukprot:XP_012846654.1 PREDICTED: uncharacterized protein LOC105966612 [Erythranthe guttata]
MVRDCPIAPRQVPGRVFAMTRDQAEADPSMIAGTVNVYNNSVYALIDSGSTHSFISSTLVAELRLVRSQADALFSILIPSGDELKSNFIIKDCPIQIRNQTLASDLIILPIKHFEIILGMDWLSKFDAQWKFSRIPKLVQSVDSYHFRHQSEQTYSKRTSMSFGRHSGSSQRR